MSSEKTEEPTQKKLDDERDKGNVPKSKDVAATLSLTALLFYLTNSMPFQFKTMAALFTQCFQAAQDAEWASFTDLFLGSAQALLWLTMPFFLVGAVMICAAYWLQFGFLFSPEALEPKMDKFNPVNNIKNMVGGDAMTEHLMSVVKLGVLSWIIYYVIKSNLNALITSLYAGFNAVVPVLVVIMKQTIIYFVVVFIILSAIDFAARKYFYTKKNKMSKEDVKREYKDAEGDPLIKHKRKKLHEEMMEQAIVDKTRKATVLVVNPTHYAVALFYEETSGTLPMVLAKGQGRLALMMIKAAEQESIPIMRDVYLARGLFAECVIDHQIPVSFIKPVAETLKWAKKFSRA